jgi:hypothetical protein
VERGATRNISFSSLLSYVGDAIPTFPDKRTGENTTYTLADICLGAFSVFFTQSPSFLAHQKGMERAGGKSNCRTIFGMEKIPSDNHIRSILDEVPGEKLHPVFDRILGKIDEAGVLEMFRSVNNDLVIALDGTQYYSSRTICCPKCMIKKQTDGSVLYSHSVLTPAIITPHLRKVLALAPEFIRNGDGREKQDCERNAARRWLSRMGPALSPLGVTLCGDDLYANQPFCEKILEEELNFLFVCKPQSHKWLYEWLAIQEHEGEMHTCERKEWTGKEHRISRYRYTDDVPLRDSVDALRVNWVELLVTDESGKQLYRNAFITNHRIDEASVYDIGEAGRARWKIENENNNTLKTKGYHLEHNFGHGKNHLSQTLATLNILAFLFHTLMELCDGRYRLLRKTLPRRDMFFDDIRALTRYFCFDDWDHLMKTMLQGLKLEDPG